MKQQHRKDRHPEVHGAAPHGAKPTRPNAPGPDASPKPAATPQAAVAPEPAARVTPPDTAAASSARPTPSPAHASTDVEPPLVLSPAARDAAARRVEDLFVESGALREGHFHLKSGRHAERYLEKFQVLQHPEAVSALCALIVELVRGPGGPLVDVVVGPTTGGVILAFETARQLGVRGIFAEEVRDPDGTTRREFRRGFRLAPGERVLLVDDILTTGGSLLAMLPPIEASDADLVLAAVLVDRSGGLTTVTSPVTGRAYPATALWTLDLPTYEPGAETCPGCAAGHPLEAPGSSGTRGAGGPIVEESPRPGHRMPPGPQPDRAGALPTSLGPAT